MVVGGITTPALAVFTLIAVALVLFVAEVIPNDVTAIGVIVSLAAFQPVFGLDVGITPRNAISGFANPATITIASRYQPRDIQGTLVLLHVVIVPGYQAQQRYLQIYDQGLNRSFPGKERANTAERMAHHVYERFVPLWEMDMRGWTVVRRPEVRC